MKKLYIDDDAADQIVVCSLNDSINLIKDSIKDIKRKRKIDNWDKNYLSECLADLDALEKVYNYYGGNLKK